MLSTARCGCCRCRGSCSGSRQQWLQDVQTSSGWDSMGGYGWHSVVWCWAAKKYNGTLIAIQWHRRDIPTYVLIQSQSRPPPRHSPALSLAHRLTHPYEAGRHPCNHRVVCHDRPPLETDSRAISTVVVASDSRCGVAAVVAAVGVAPPAVVLGHWAKGWYGISGPAAIAVAPHRWLLLGRTNIITSSGPPELSQFSTIRCGDKG